MVSEKDESAKALERIMLEKITTHKTNIVLLLKSGQALPDEMVLPLIEIGEQSKLILARLVSSPEVFKQGDRFLSRYLERAQAIVSQAIEVGKSPDSARFSAALERARNALQSLSAAFRLEYQRLLEGDAQNLNIESGLVERLLKMEGYKSE